MYLFSFVNWIFMSQNLHTTYSNLFSIMITNSHLTKIDNCFQSVTQNVIRNQSDTGIQIKISINKVFKRNTLWLSQLERNQCIVVFRNELHSKLYKQYVNLTHPYHTNKGIYV